MADRLLDGEEGRAFREGGGRGEGDAVGGDEAADLA